MLRAFLCQGVKSCYSAGINFPLNTKDFDPFLFKKIMHQSYIILVSSLSGKEKEKMKGVAVFCWLTQLSWY